MARDVLRVNFNLDRIACYDEGDGWGNAEPYLWTVFFKIDGSSVHLTDGLRLSGTATVETTPGSHGNLGTTDVDAGDVVPIPNSIGTWSPLLTPIPVPDAVKPFIDDLSGVGGVVCVLMEEDNVSDDGANAGHAALNSAIQAALDDVIATRTFANQDITPADIDAYLGAVSNAIKGAIQNQQSFFENLWSFINPDDQIGSHVWFFKHDDLASGSPIAFSQRWENEGDWELFGSVNATVACPAAAVAVLGEIFRSIFQKAESGMRTFRDREFSKNPGLAAWWQLAERNTPELIRLIGEDESLQGPAAALLELAGGLGGKSTTHLPDAALEQAKALLLALAERGNRRARIDASRALSLLPHLWGKTIEDAVRLVAAVPPARHPRESADVGGLLDVEGSRSRLRPARPVTGS